MADTLIDRIQDSLGRIPVFVGAIGAICIPMEHLEDGNQLYEFFWANFPGVANVAAQSV